jgi:putative hydrolase of the HAD superfamily
MTIRAVVFDIGGILEIGTDTYDDAKWEAILGLEKGELNQKMGHIWADGSEGRCTESDVHQALREFLGMNETHVKAYMDDMWKSYLGTLNGELAAYFRSLHTKYQTAILSNSFVGAREKEEAAYHFSEMVEFIIYSHEVGMSKPDPRIFDLLCERLGLPPDEIIFLDDVAVHVAAARKLGIHAIQYQDNAQAIADIESLLQT